MSGSIWKRLYMGQCFNEMVNKKCIISSNRLLTKIKTQRMKLLLLLIIILVCASVSAQVNLDSMKQQYNTKTMRISNGIAINGYRIGKTEVQNLMVISPEANSYYKLYLKNNKPAMILPFIGLAASISGLIVQKNNRSSGLILLISGSVVNAVGSVFKVIANHHLQNAVWTYNRDILFPVK